MRTIENVNQGQFSSDLEDWNSSSITFEEGESFALIWLHFDVDVNVEFVSEFLEYIRVCLIWRVIGRRRYKIHSL